MIKTPGKIRIIGGKWRSRKIDVPDAGVRPTPDAVRETLFNWLIAVIPKAQCLDLFAGSGALGFEALSRGAAHVDMVDSSSTVIANLTEQVKIFDTKEDVSLYQMRLPDGLCNLPVKQYNIVFIDAPFRRNLLEPCAKSLAENHFLAPGAFIYMEMESELKTVSVPNGWELWRHKSMGQVTYTLYHYNA